MKILIAFMVFSSQVDRGGSMDVLLALGGMAGAAYLLAPAAPLPSETEYKKAMEKLMTTPEDPDANTTVGKYLSFVAGDYPGGMKFLSKSGDKNLRTLAEHELAPLYTDTGPKKVGMGDEWVAAAKLFKPLFRIFYDRAAWWYGQAWLEMKNQPLWGEKLRERLQKIYTIVPGVPPAKNLALPTGWKSLYPDTKASRSTAAARAGSASLQISGWKSPLPSYTAATQSVDVKPGSYRISAWAITDDTDQDDGFLLAVQNQNGNNLLLKPFTVPKDQPWWKKVVMDVDVPADGSRIVLAFNVNSKQGTIFLDEFSVKGADDRELLKNPGFEDR